MLLVALAVTATVGAGLGGDLSALTEGRPPDGTHLVAPVLRSVLLWAAAYITLVVALAAASRLPTVGRWFGRLARIASGASAGALSVRVLGVSLSLASMAPGTAAAEAPSEPPVMRPVAPDDDSGPTPSLEVEARRAVLADRPPPPPDGAAPADDPPILRRTDEPSGSPTETAGVGRPARPAPPRTEPTTSGRPAALPLGGGSDPAERTGPSTDSDDGAVHTVVAGESFWTIAEDTMRESGQWDAEAVTRYWRRLIEANRDRLVEPGNPDLIHVGQELRLPR